jgi:bifunctional non-homologous end joining protein LigD
VGRRYETNGAVPTSSISHLHPVMDTKRENPASICPHCGASKRLAMTIEGDGEIVFEHSCKLGCEGIVSKRLGSSYRSGRVDCWVKVKTLTRQQ